MSGDRSPAITKWLEEKILCLLVINGKVKEKARERQLATQLDGRDKEGKPKFKVSVAPSEGGTEEQGKAIRIAAERVGVSHNTLSCVDRIKRAGDLLSDLENVQKIKKMWDNH